MPAVFPQARTQHARRRYTRGTGGPLWASAIRQRHELVDAFVAASNRLGVRTVDDFNTGDQEGVGYYQLTTRNGLRCSTAVAYLKPRAGGRTCMSKPMRRR